jgi:hypothetical protein
MRRIIHSSNWWLPVTAGLLIVLFITTVILRMGPRPAVAPGELESTRVPAVPVTITNVSVDDVQREYRGWLEVSAGTVTVRVTAPGADIVKVAHWLTTEDAPVIDATALRQMPSAVRQADGTWTASWDMKTNQTAHAIAYAEGAADGGVQSDTLNIRAVAGERK